MKLLVCLVAVFSFGAFGAGCSKPNELACCTSEADCAAVGLPLGQTCGENLTCENHTCVAAGCESDADCPSDRGVCTGGQCVECDAAHGCTAGAPVCNVITETCGGCVTDAHCDAYADTPRCDAEAGTCVGCVRDDHCPAASPVCDEGSCRACRLDSECPSGACSELGTCVAEQEVVYVATSGVDAGTCVRAAPCKTLEFGLGRTGAQRSYVVMAPGEYLVAATIPNNAPEIRVLATGARMQGDASGDAMISSFSTGFLLRGAEMYGAREGHALNLSGIAKLRNVHIHDTGGMMVFGTLDAQDLKIERALTPAILLGSQANLKLDRGNIAFGTIGIECSATSVGASKIELQNVLIARTSSYAISCNPGSGVVKFSTIADAGGSGACAVQAGSTLAFESSIVWSPCSTGLQPPITGGTFTTSIVGPGSVPGAMSINPQFVNPQVRDYHLQPGSPAIDAVDAGPAHDFEGDPRPRGQGYDLGADEAP